MSPKTLALACLIPAVVCAAGAKSQLDAIVAEAWEFQLRSSPEYATVIGDARFNDRLSDYSLASLQAMAAKRREFLGRLERIDAARLSPPDRLNRALLMGQLRRDIEAFRLRLFEEPFNQFNGEHLDLTEIGQTAPFLSARDYENYLARLKQVPRVIGEWIELSRLGARDRLVLPRRLLEKVAEQAAAIGVAGEANPFAEPLRKFPGNMPAEERARLRDAILAAIAADVVPAYQNLARYVREDYAPKGRTEDGVWAAPGGEKIYAFLVRRWTTTDYTPDQIHALGLAQVAETEAQMHALAKRLGYADLKALQTAVRANRKLYASSREEILERYRKYIDRMYEKLPEFFGRLPKARLAVHPIEPYREKSAAAAEYRIGTPDGSRPGRVMINTGDFDKRSLTTMEATAYHEGAPGHHMQIALALETPDQPPFRRHAFYSAFLEGWALYAERLAKEMGFFEDPYSEYGRLSSEMLRSIRLVVDTGVHSKRWTRQQMVDYFHAHSTEDEPDVQAEVDRYIAMPGQALAYKVGQLKMLDLRERARRELGARFDLRAFHDEVLGGGALPLDALEQRIAAWIAARKAASNKAGD